jgi:hypothetical protein
MIRSQSCSLATRCHPSIARCVARAVQRSCWAGGRALSTASAAVGASAPLFGSFVFGSFIVADMLNLLRYLAELGKRPS